MKKALVLFSGGLDSILAVKIIQSQNIEVTGLNFASYFFDSKQAEKSAEEIGLKLLKEDIAQKQLEIVKNPKHGSGTGLNPCIDCHALMIRKGLKIAKEKNFDILATGEVLGQRPFSQNSRALKIVEKEAGAEGKVLRPLSAKLLEETDYEKKNLVDREKFFGISGRSRKIQMDLAEKLGIKKYPTPSGGCVLAEKGFSLKAKTLIDKGENLERADFELLRIGRHIWFDDFHIILGKSKEENEGLEKYAGKNFALVRPVNFKGPGALVRMNKSGEIEEEQIEKVKKIILSYTRKEKCANIKPEFEIVR